MSHTFFCLKTKSDCLIASKEVTLVRIGRRNRKMCHSFNSNNRQLKTGSSYLSHWACDSCLSLYLELKATLDLKTRYQMLHTLFFHLFETAVRHLFISSQTKLAFEKSRMTLLFFILWVTFNLGACEAYLNGGTGDPCVGTIHLHTNTSSSLTLIRDKRWAFYTDNSNSQYHVAPSRSFSLIARDLCRIVFASPIWRSTCYGSKDEEANQKCLRMADVLHERAFIEPSKTTELWNRAFAYFNHSTTPDALINQSQ
ncbi:hypothetical protein PGT21_034926 [Puccinia graminis f. sp. tritici]|uniref:Uncharacterized protein n=2 Tax=Puccinia graminis f. sp. tritici TaxID=56615 RepID=A0A5B0QDE9_PUCGR|nr:hypothetical protein PGT21_034926 [Puccinia graminis f. sp. tritici]